MEAVSIHTELRQSRKDQIANSGKMGQNLPCGLKSTVYTNFLFFSELQWSIFWTWTHL